MRSLVVIVPFSILLTLLAYGCSDADVRTSDPMRIPQRDELLIIEQLEHKLDTGDADVYCAVAVIAGAGKSTYYGWYQCDRWSGDAKHLYHLSGSRVPAAFSIDDEAVDIDEISDGGNYERKVRNVFPDDVADNILTSRPEECALLRRTLERARAETNSASANASSQGSTGRCDLNQDTQRPA